MHSTEENAVRFGKMLSTVMSEGNMLIRTVTIYADLIVGHNRDTDSTSNQKHILLPTAGDGVQS